MSTTETAQMPLDAYVDWGRYYGNSATAREMLLIRARDTGRRRYWQTHDREGHACRACGASDVPLEVHRRDGDPLNNHLINLTAVCHCCHRAAHRQRNTTAKLRVWKWQFYDKLTTESPGVAMGRERR